MRPPFHSSENDGGRFRTFSDAGVVRNVTLRPLLTPPLRNGREESGVLARVS